jgi:hypothetical protein
MDEEKAVLDFFVQRENLPLALSVGEQVDRIRERMNNEFWIQLNSYLLSRFEGWISSLTEDHSAPDCLVGIHLRPQSGQNLFLQPMLEQQFSQGAWRIYFGLMWSSTPTFDKINLKEIVALRDALQGDGYKDNNGFMAWRWTTLHPRGKDFLLRFDTQREELLKSAVTDLIVMIDRHSDLLQAANRALADAPKSAAISLAKLHTNISR